MSQNCLRAAITISRQSGSGAHAIGERLGNYLQTHIPCHCPWTMFDQNLVEQVLEDHHLSKRIARFMPEDRMPQWASLLEEILDLHPNPDKMVLQTSETIMRLAEMGT